MWAKASISSLSELAREAARRGGSIHLDMFQDLLLAEFVVADLTLDNPNVWYEIGVRHALRAGGAVLTYGLRDRSAVSSTTKPRPLRADCDRAGTKAYS